MKVDIHISKTLAHYTKIPVSRNKRIQKRTRKEWKIYIRSGEPLCRNSETKKNTERERKREKQRKKE